jgi:hypothetical protein
LAPQEVAAMIVDDALPPGKKKAAWLYAGMAMLGWLVLFVPALTLFLGFCSCGVLWLDTDLAAFGKTVAMLLGGGLAIFATLVLVQSTQDVIPLVAWLLAVISTAGWVRYRLGWDDDWSWIDDPS